MFCSQNGSDLDLTNELVVCWPMRWQCVGSVLAVCWQCVGRVLADVLVVCWWCVSRVSADAVADASVGLDSLPLPLKLCMIITLYQFLD